MDEWLDMCLMRTVGIDYEVLEGTQCRRFWAVVLGTKPSLAEHSLLGLGAVCMQI